MSLWVNWVKGHFTSGILNEEREKTRTDERERDYGKKEKKQR